MPCAPTNNLSYPELQKTELQDSLSQRHATEACLKTVVAPGTGRKKDKLRCPRCGREFFWGDDCRCQSQNFGGGLLSGPTSLLAHLPRWRLIASSPVISIPRDTLADDLDLSI